MTDPMYYEKGAERREQGGERLQSPIKLVKIFYRTAPSSLLTPHYFSSLETQNRMSLRVTEGCRGNLITCLFANVYMRPLVSLGATTSSSVYD